MKIEVIFMSSSGVKIIDNVKAVYTKDGFCCIQVAPINESQIAMIIKYPLMNIFSVCHPHGEHWGSKKFLEGKS